MQYNPEELDEILRIYNSESEEIIQQLNDYFLLLEKNPLDKTPLKKLFQLAHSLKGASRMIGFNNIQNIAHKLEDILSFWGQDDVKINSDMFEEIYHVCDFLLDLIHKSVVNKSEIADKDITVFINKLDNFITFNRIIPEKQENNIKDNLLIPKTEDINAIILELMFVLETENDYTLEEVVPVINDNISKLEEIFNNTNYDEIKNELKSIIEYAKLNDNFKFEELKSKILHLRNLIYNLFKNLNITTNLNKQNNLKTTEKKEEKNKNIDNVQETGLKKEFEYIFSNLHRIKNEKDISKEIINNLEKIHSFVNENKLEPLFSKIINILNMINNNNFQVDNDCYLVMLQCIIYIRRCISNHKEFNEVKLNSLSERLNLVEDMFNTTVPELRTPAESIEHNSLISLGEYDNLKKNIKSFDMEEIKVLRVDSDKVDNLIGQTGELLINGIKTQEHLLRLSQIYNKLSKLGNVSKKIINYIKYLEKRGFFLSDSDESTQVFYKKTQNFFMDTSEMITGINIDFNNLYNIISEDDNKLHQTVMEIDTIAKTIRVLPLASIFHSFPRMMRDIAKENNKKINFIINGSDTTVDKKIIEEIKMPLIHILRNAVSHGIEEPELRIKNNKKEEGLVKLTAKQAENNVIITIEDDGYGINYEKIKSTAIKKGILTQEEADNIPQEQLMKILFLPGFSTRDSISEISGRGIGLDVVKTKIANLNGELSIDSELNKGCRVTIKLPISMSTIKTFILLVNNQKYAIPVGAIKYIKQITKNDIFKKNGINSILFEEHSIPIYYLSEILGEENYIYTENNLFTVIIIENQERQAAYIVDKLIGDQEIFNKKLVPPILKIKNISGFTTLSSGEICLIINPFELIRNTVLADYNSLFEIKNISIEDKKLNLKDKKALILSDANNNLTFIKNDLTDTFDYIIEFNNINSTYDYIQKNDTDIIICCVTDVSEEVIRLIRYLKSDENYYNVKLVILSDITEYELNEKLRECKYNLYYKLTSYNKEEFINKLSMIY